MKVDEIAGLQQTLNELKIKLRSDSNVPIERLGELYAAVHELEVAIGDYKATHVEEGARPDIATLERLSRKLSVIEAIQGMQNPS